METPICEVCKSNKDVERLPPVDGPGPDEWFCNTCDFAWPVVEEEEPRMKMEPRTIQDAAKDAIAVQDACNLSGVVRSFAELMPVVREHVKAQGTDAINRHPVCVLFASKIADLAGQQGGLAGESFARYHFAYEECKRLAEGKG